MPGRNIIIFQFQPYIIKCLLLMKDERPEGITRDGYKKHCSSSHHYKIDLRKFIVTEELGEEVELRCLKCDQTFSRENTYIKHFKQCKGWPQ